MDDAIRRKPALTGFVQVRGAREHNLKNIDVQIPRDALVVFTGVSGSGKSSLAFGTLYAEAQRRYFESVAPYGRRLIEQRGTPGARSSVGSVTTLSSLVRMLYSRTGAYPPKQPMLFAEDFSPNTVQGADHALRRAVGQREPRVRSGRRRAYLNSTHKKQRAPFREEGRTRMLQLTVTSVRSLAANRAARPYRDRGRACADSGRRRGG
jgi:excinuclease UvrABC ATPase subunit